MPKKWSEVIASPEYAKLSPQDQFLAKKDYFDTVVTPKISNQEDIPLASKEFFGGELQKPITPEEMGQLETEQKEAQNIPLQVGRQLVSGANRAINTATGNIPEIIMNKLGATGYAKNEDPIIRATGEAVGFVAPGGAPMKALEAGNVITNPLTRSMAQGAGVMATQLPVGDENLGEYATKVAGGAAVGALARGAEKVVESVSKPISQKITETIDNLYHKGVKPTTSKGNFTKIEANKKNAESAIHSIIDNKNNLSLGEEGHALPQNLQHFSEAVGQTKDDIFNQYNAMQEQATGKGVTISGEALAQELQPILSDKSLDVVSPTTKKYAADLFERLQNSGDLTPSELQNIIKGFNGRLKAYYQNPSPDAYGATAVDALIANNARKQLDNSISNAVGEGYQALKNKYGALSAIEKDVTRAAQRSANYQHKGLLDFSDIFTGEQMVRGLLTMNPAEFTSGAVGRGIKQYYKMLNNPNAVISKMFNTVDRLKQAENNPALMERVKQMADETGKSVSEVLEKLKGEQGQLGFAGSVKGKDIVPLPKLTLDVRSKLTPDEVALAKKQTTPDEASTIAQWHKAYAVPVAGATALGIGSTSAQASDFDNIMGFEGGVQKSKSGQVISNMGIEKPTLREFNQSTKKNYSVDKLTKEQAKEVYDWYFKDYKPSVNDNRLNTIIRDDAFHWGKSAGVKHLQRAVGAKVDGVWGKNSQKALDNTIKSVGADEVSNRLIRIQKSYMKSRNNYEQNKVGWENRLQKLANV